MTLPSKPPLYVSQRELHAPIIRGEKGWRVWALQRGLDADPLIACTPDGDFGPATEKAVKRFQGFRFIDQVGFAGPATQRALLSAAEEHVHAKLPKLPQGVLLGFTNQEGAGVLAATNWYTPEGDPPGVDLGPVQWRLLGPPFSEAEMKKRFDSRSAFTYAGTTLLDRMAEYQRRRKMSDSMALRLALLAHNAPFLSEQWVKNGKLTTPDKRPTSGQWAIHPDGHGYYSHAEWMQVYPDRILSYVV